MTGVACSNGPLQNNISDFQTLQVVRNILCCGTLLRPDVCISDRTMRYIFPHPEESNNHPSEYFTKWKLIISLTESESRIILFRRACTSALSVDCLQRCVSSLQMRWGTYQYILVPFSPLRCLSNTSFWNVKKFLYKHYLIPNPIFFLGDGTMLLAASKVLDQLKPVIGINTDPDRWA